MGFLSADESELVELCPGIDPELVEPCPGNAQELVAAWRYDLAQEV